LSQINVRCALRQEHGVDFITEVESMFLFFDLFAKILNYEPGRPRDSAEERREASIGARRVARRRAAL